MSETVTVTTPPPLSINLVMDQSTMQALRADEAITTMLDAYVIDGPEMAVIVNDELRGTIQRIAEIKKLKAGFVAPAKTIIGNAEALFDPAIEARVAFEKGLRLKLTNYTIEQERIAAEARRVAEEDARKARQKAEQEAAAARAKAGASAKEQQRQADEARAAAAMLEAEGKAQAAAAQAALAAKLDEKASATIENAEVHAMQATVAAAAEVVVVPAAHKVAGFGLRDNWKAELAPGHDEPRSVAEIARAFAAGRTDLLPLLRIDTSACDKLAKALKGAMNVPGLVAVNRPSSTSRAA